MLPARNRQNTLSPFNSLLEEFFGDLIPERTAQSGYRPPLDLREGEGHYYAQLELPGMSKEEIKISLENNVLTIRGEKKQEQVDDNEEYRRVERSYGVFERCFRMPQEIRDGEIRAEMKNGVLKISIPNTEKVEPRQISIN